MVAACASVTASGSGASVRVGTAARSAHAPVFTRPTTRVPSAGPLPSAASRSTTPARAQAAIVPSGWLGRGLPSPRLSEKAFTATSASDGAGRGSLTCVRSMCGSATEVVSASIGGTYTAVVPGPAMPEWVGHGPARKPRPRRIRTGGAQAGVGGRAPLAARGPFVAGAPARARGGLRAALAAAARPRPDRALQGVPEAQAQDPGVRGARGRPLPHAADAHARGDADLAHGGARAAPERGPDRGDGAGPRRRPPAVRAHRRGGARRVRARAVRARLPPQRALAPSGRDDRGAEPDRGGARRDPAALQRRRRARDAGGQ